MISFFIRFTKLSKLYEFYESLKIIQAALNIKTKHILYLIFFIRIFFISIIFIKIFSITIRGAFYVVSNILRQISLTTYLHSSENT